MKNKVLVLFVLMIGYGCTVTKKTNFIQSNYCIVNDKYNSMTLEFRIKGDSAFLFYCNIIDNGNYINGCFYEEEDSMNYAGYFRLSDIKDSTIKFKIKSYRDEDIDYLLNLKLKNNGDILNWAIESKAVGYLPKKAVFKRCKKG